MDVAGEVAESPASVKTAMKTSPTDAEVRDNPHRSRYELLVDGQVLGVADYQPIPEAVVVSHTEVSPTLRGKGYSPILVRFLLEDLRDRGLGIVPSCWYVAQYIDDHPEFAGLLRP